MNLFLVVPVALALAMDAFAVSIALSVVPGGMNKSQSLRLAFFFGFFQFGMPVIGWLAGQSFLDDMRSVDHWVAFGLLCLIGGKMVAESFRYKGPAKKMPGDLIKGSAMLLLAIATSIDAFAVGLSFAAIEQKILFPSVIIGIVAFALTFLGTKLGPAIGRIAGKRAELLGGLILIFIGVKILADHL